ncbi:MAG: PspC domain-containing protein [Candidatus Omnitrophota bacterium]|jgi:phage shock protein C|nr:MAG: PspC domain-containing protein [Candidatus Omnitrophota bacterium]
MNFHTPNQATKNPMDADLLAAELRQCWTVYQDLKQKTEQISRRDDIPHELIGTVNQVASQQFTENVRNVLLKYSKGLPAQESTQAFQSQTGKENPDDKTASPLGPEPKSKTKFSQKRMYRAEDDKMLAGVCGGLSDYFNVDSNIIRVIFVVTTFAPVPSLGLIAYIALAIVLPLKSTETLSA